MSKTTDYKTAEGEDPSLLDQAIKELIAEGYQPYGSPYAAKKHFCQAMIKQQDVVRPEPLGGPGFSSAS